MTKWAHILGTLMVTFISLQAYAERGDDNDFFCRMRITCKEPQREYNCSIAGGVGYRERLVGARPNSFTMGRGGATYCAVAECAEGFKKAGALCLPLVASKDCKIPNGSGRQDQYGQRWSSCAPKECAKNFTMVRGLCVAKNRKVVAAKACLVGGGKGTLTTIVGNQSFCKVTSCNKGLVQKGNTCVVSTAPVVKVNLVILRKDDGTGNQKWNSVYILRMIDQLTELTKGNVKFTLGRVTYANRSSDFHNPKQDNIKMRYIQFREFGAITGIVSQHNTTDSRGTAMGIKYNYEPIFVFRSWYNDGSAKDSLWAAKVFLHELGHNMGMKHNYHSSVHMDNHYSETPGVLRDYARGLNLCKIPSVACVANYAKFGNYIGMASND